MAGINYMTRLAASRGGQQHAAGAAVLHADEKRKRRKRRKPLSRKQKAALAKGRRIGAQMRRAKKRHHGAEERKMPRRRKRSSKRTRTIHKLTQKKFSGRRPSKRTKRKGAVGTHNVGKRPGGNVGGGFRRRKSTALVRVGSTAMVVYKKRKKRKKSHKAAHKRHYKKAHMAKRKHKSSKRSRAAKKAARTRKRNHAMRSAAARKAARSRKHKGHGHKRGYRRKRSKVKATYRRKTRGRIRRKNAGRHGGQFVARGGRIHGRKVKGGYHRAGRIVAEGHYGMENPLSGSELGVGLATGLIGFVAAELTDRYLAGGSPPLGGTLYAAASPIYSNYYRLGAGALLSAGPLVGAHFVRAPHVRAALQFFGFGAGIRTLGHLVNDLLVHFMGKSNGYVQAMYPHEIIAQNMLAGVAAAPKTGAGALPEDVGMHAGLGQLPEGLAACCNTTSRMLNAALSPLTPIGRSPGEGTPYPPPVERTGTDDGSGGGGNGGGGQPRHGTYIPPAHQQFTTPGRPAMVPIPPQMGIPATSMIAAAVPAAPALSPIPAAAAFPAGATPSGGVNGLPSRTGSPFSWGEER